MRKFFYTMLLMMSILSSCCLEKQEDVLIIEVNSELEDRSVDNNTSSCRYCLAYDLYSIEGRWQGFTERQLISFKEGEKASITIENPPLGEYYIKLTLFFVHDDGDVTYIVDDVNQKPLEECKILTFTEGENNVTIKVKVRDKELLEPIEITQ